MRNLIDRFILSRFERDQSRELLDSLEALSLQGQAQAKAATWITAASLLAFEHSVGESHFARALGCLGKPGVALTTEDEAALAACCVSLAERRRRALAENTALMQLIAVGIPVWITSIQALLEPDRVPLAIAVWDIVGSGDDAMAQRDIDRVLSSLKPDTDLTESITRMRRKPLAPAYARPPTDGASDFALANGRL